jgi:hypothetical protein
LRVRYAPVARMETSSYAAAARRRLVREVSSSLHALLSARELLVRVHWYVDRLAVVAAPRPGLGGSSHARSLAFYAVPV